MITIIVAIAENNAIGYKNNLLCHIPGDLKRFKDITMGHCLVMGKKTWESLPKKPLHGRKNIVLSDNTADSFEGAFTAFSIDEALAMCDPGKELFIIGGGMVYRQFLPLADRLLITHLHKAFEADTYFPEIDPDIWEETDSQEHIAYTPEPLSFSYTTYFRKTE
jgi:dihydrofolate reductase